MPMSRRFWPAEQGRCQPAQEDLEPERQHDDHDDRLADHAAQRDPLDAPPDAEHGDEASGIATQIGAPSKARDAQVR